MSTINSEKSIKLIQIHSYTSGCKIGFSLILTCVRNNLKNMSIFVFSLFSYSASVCIKNKQV